MKYRLFVQLILFWLPWALRRLLLVYLLGYSIDRSARLGLSLVLAGEVEIGPHARIGHLTVVKGLSRLTMGEYAILGNLNWVTAVPLGTPRHFLHLVDRSPELVIARHSAITHRHMIDCTGGIRIAPFVTIAGWGSQFISHSFDFRASRQDAAPIEIGEYAFVGSRCILLKGVNLPAKCILSAGSVLGERNNAGEYGLYRGNPAKRAAELSGDLEYFTRSEGYIE